MDSVKTERQSNVPFSEITVKQNKSFTISLKRLNQKTIYYMQTYIFMYKDIIIDEDYASKSTKIIRVDK